MQTIIVTCGIAGDRKVQLDLADRRVPACPQAVAIFEFRLTVEGIPGINEVLRRRGLLPSRRCLNPAEEMSPGQAERIDRVSAAYSWLVDDAFVLENRERWLSES